MALPLKKQIRKKEVEIGEKKEGGKSEEKMNLANGKICQTNLPSLIFYIGNC